jgi:FixJ family two-component response regulator
MSQSTPLVRVVDDDDDVGRAIGRLLRSVGYQVETFVSPAAFLARASEDRPGCAVLDVQMPELSGLELQEELGRAGQAVPIVFLTGHGTVPIATRAMKAGAIDVLIKPMDQQELLIAIERAIARDAAARAHRAEVAELSRRLASLTPREHQVFSLVVTGLMNKQIAARLGTTLKTIKAHRGRVMEKMEAQSVAELVHMAIRADFACPPATAAGVH